MTYLESIKYQAFYCEENIWQLCQQPQYRGGQVIFIASDGDYFPMYFQKTGQGKDKLIFWDYHVVLLHQGMILDFSSELGFSTPLKYYLDLSFIDEDLLEPSLVPKFRILSDTEYVTFFQSDRRHMMSDSGWSATPPDWPLISENASNLEQFTNMRDLTFGKVFSAKGLLEYYSNLCKQAPTHQH
ncbi:MAG: hypothetical protein CSB47_06855 [Proteobacteria bacterium]|nr:MAG: hypothetical protein CSB47_06855 [Pseudomonadota bacterium]